MGSPAQHKGLAQTIAHTGLFSLSLLLFHFHLMMIYVRKLLKLVSESFEDFKHPYSINDQNMIVSCKKRTCNCFQ
jgi:hypothetical protein